MALQIPDQNIAASGTQYNPINTLGQVSNIVNAGNQIQLGRQQIQSNEINLQSQGQANQERQNLMGFMKDPSNFQNDDGTVSMQKLNAAVPSLAPQTGADFLAKMSNLSTAQTGAKQASMGLSNTQRNIAGQTVGLLGRYGEQDPAKYAEALHGLADQFPDNPEMKTAASAIEKVITAVPKGPAVPAIAQKLQAQFLSNPEQQAAFTPTANLTPTGGQLTPTVNIPSVAGSMPNVQKTGGAPLQLTLPPGGQQQVTTDANNNPIVINRAPTGQLQNVSGAPIAGQPTTTQPVVIPAGETQQSRQDLINKGTQVANAASAVPNQHAYNNNIIRMASDPNFTNPNTLLGVAQSYGVHVGAGDYRTELNGIAHNIALNTQANEQGMGVTTDAGRQTSALATGSLEMTPKALANAAKQNEASATGLANYNKGLQTAMKVGPNGYENPFAQRQFQNNWTQNYDQNVMLLNNAIKAGRKDEVSEIIKNVGGPGSAGAKALTQKANNLKSLTNTGQLPDQGQ